MGARQKLNRSYFNGSLIVAAVAGWLARSWRLFWIALAVLLGFNIYRREIRPGRHERRDTNAR